MALPAKVDTLDDVPESVRGEYHEQDGVFILDVGNLDEHPGVANLSKALKSERKLLQEAKASLKSARAAGDPEEIAAKLARLDELEAKAGAGDPADLAVKKAREKWQAEAESDRKKLEAERDDLRQRYRKVALGDRLKSLVLAADPLTKLVDDIVTLTGRHFDLDEDGRMVVVDSDGTPSSLTPEKWMERYREERPELFKAKSGSGTGTPKGVGSGDRGAAKTIAAGDETAFFDNLAGIAKGTTVIK